MAKPKGAAISRPILIERRSMLVFQAGEEAGPTILATLKI